MQNARNAEGYETPFDKNWGSIAFNRLSGLNPDFQR